MVMQAREWIPLATQHRPADERAISHCHCVFDLVSARTLLWSERDLSLRGLSLPRASALNPIWKMPNALPTSPAPDSDNTGPVE
jgi:hypothetical protein